ncbi:MAG TPA: beta-galactosidase [Steroidobacteraceae bacterium]|jgi:hypothetical protein
MRWLWFAVALTATISAGWCRATTLLEVDASAAPPPPQTGYLHTGTTRSISGHSLEINSRYLMLDGQPWLPVMGEFHYTRVPERYWDQELAKMRAAGVDVVSSYVIWQHHEQHAGEFNWRGDRDLRAFVQACARHGLYVMLRLGPWVHAEVRFGGLPDWVVDGMPTRSNDPTYLHYVERFYGQIGAQVQGLMWKDDGPIIGIQLENEYFLNGPGQGREHIARLKQLAIAAGFDVPLYTVTAWDNTIYPAHEVTPVFGSYPDAPWATSPLALPANEAYAFRFDSRVTGDTRPASLAKTAAGDADRDRPNTPFLSAEYAGGLPGMYRRRNVVSPDDIAALLPIQIGSGVNLYGYYMFHGGRNPDGEPSREENTGIGGYNDLPKLGYDFQAPLGEYGQAHAVLAKLRPMHYFLNSFGAQLAPMEPRKPAHVPADPDDLTSARFAVRSLGEQAFLFYSSHVRLYPMSAQRAVQFSIRLPQSTVTLPSRPIDLPADRYFVWPINLSLDGARMIYATAQPVTRLPTDRGSVYVFRAVDGIPVEMAFDAQALNGMPVVSGHARSVRSGGRIIVSDIAPGTASTLMLRPRGGAAVQIIVLTASQAERLWVIPMAGRTRLLLTDALAFASGNSVELRSIGEPQFQLAVLPALAAVPTASPALRRDGHDGVFERWRADAPRRTVEVSSQPIRAAQPMPPVAVGGPAQAALQPAPESFGKSAAWSIELPAAATEAGEVFLQIDYRGDVARLFSGPQLLDDEYFDGLTWDVGLQRYADQIGQGLMLSILPLRQDAPIYFEPQFRPTSGPDSQLAQLLRVRATPEYRLRID